MADNYKVDSAQVLSIKHRIFLSGLKSVALQKPSLYFQIRQKVLQDLEEKMCETTYEMFYSLLKNGTIGCNPIKAPDGAGSFTLPAPEVPVQKINQLALQVANDISQSIESAIDIILPENFDKIVESKMKLKSSAATIDSA